jgi:lipoate-protein ligase A
MRQYTQEWRLIYDTPMHGGWNMALDEAMLRSVANHSQPPTLRLYAWQPACLSLGYGQQAKIVDRERLQSLGWELTRRPTGGGAILHADELTYSIALPEDHPIARGGILESYRHISEALMLALQQLGAQPGVQPTGSAIPATVVCFETPSHYEITANNKKLVGSAQARRHQGMLQHGTLPLYGDIAQICDGLVYANEQERDDAKARVRDHAITLSDALGGHSIDWQTAAAAVREGFSETFDISFCHGTWSEAEWRCAEELCAVTYGEPSWVLRR